MRRGSIVMLVAIGTVAFIATAAVAVFIPWLPDQASEEREGIDFVFWLATWICVTVFAVVAAIMGTAVIKFRARPDDDSDGAPIHGHTGLEIIWTAIPALLVIVLGVSSAVVLAENDKARGSTAEARANANRIKVTAQQFAWHFEYPRGRQSGALIVPMGRSTVLEMTARDVIHSFFVPEFGQKRDVVPGIVTKLVITPKRSEECAEADEDGVFCALQLECTELCGLGHSLMRTRVEVVTDVAYARFLREGEEEANDPAALFNSAGCAGCHTFAPAGATGTTGPSLDDLPNDPQFVRQSIVEPNADITEGYEANVMPQDFGEKLSSQQIDALVQYLLEGAK